MSKEATIFNKINSQAGFCYSGAQIAKWSGLDKSLISRFLNGKTDISVSKFFQLISSMPTPFQEAYWAELLSLDYQDRSWRLLVSKASYVDLQEILNAIADRWADLGEVKESELASVG